MREKVIKCLNFFDFKNERYKEYQAMTYKKHEKSNAGQSSAYGKRAFQ